MTNKVDMSVTLAGMTMKNPVVVASGTFGFGREYGQFYPIDELGGICVKGLTLHRREGNPASQNCRDTYGHPELRRPSESRRGWIYCLRTA